MTSASKKSLTSLLGRVDLNLLLALDTLLRERSVTRAAATLGLSQPALSASLAKLRRYFHDELLTRVGKSYELTPLALSLTDRTAAALAAAGQVFGTQSSFDPLTSDREFTVYLSDYATAVLAAPLARLTRSEAPHVRMHIQQLHYSVVDNAAETLRDHDGIVVPHGFISDARYADLFTDRFVCVVSGDNDTVGDAITMEQLASMPMVVAYHGPTAYTPAVKQLRMAGIETNVETVTESFLVLPFLIAGTDRIGIVPSLLAERFSRMADIRIVDCPFELMDLVDALWWHHLNDDDPGHRWFRSVLQRAAASL